MSDNEIVKLRKLYKDGQITKEQYEMLIEEHISKQKENISEMNNQKLDDLDYFSDEEKVDNNSNSNVNSNNEYTDNDNQDYNVEYNNNKKTPFYDKAWFFVLICFILPFVALPFMFIKKKHYSKAKKIILTIFLSAYSLFFVFTWINEPESKTTDTQQKQAPTNSSKKEEPKKEEPKKVNKKKRDVTSTDINDEIIPWGWLQDSAKDTINSVLKSPSTAEYPGSFLDQFEGWQFSRKGNKLTLSSYVDSQNSYGAMIRSYFTVEFKYNFDKSKAKVVYLVFDGDVLVDQ